MTTCYESTDPGAAYERQFALRQERLAEAEECEAKGWTWLADRCRRQAAGHKAELTRIARREGWV